MFKRILLAAVVLAVCVVVGMRISSQKLLWNDELFTQVETIDRLSVGSILRAQFQEGNLSPLFYLGQKAFCLVFDYHLPVRWKGEFCVYEPRGQRLLRILPVMYMSLAVAGIFLYLSFRGSVFFAFVGLAVTLSGFSVWAFLPEARPYGLWFLLCSLQGILLMEVLGRKSGESPRVWHAMALVNVLSSLTIFFSAVTVIAVSMVLFLKDRGRYARSSFFLTVVPVGICILYYVIAQRTYAGLSQGLGSYFAMIGHGAAMFFSGGFLPQKDLLLMNVPPYWLFFIGVGAAVIGAGRRAGAPGQDASGDMGVFKGMLLAFVVMLFLAVMIVIWFMGWAAKGNFPVTERYFIFLTPFSVLLIMSIMRILWDRARADSGWRLTVVVGTGAMIALTSLWTYIHLMKWGPFWSV